ncbi:aspartyl protease family protein [Solitalea lacus]|uniref:aspartyl protease family protein n=1 Tax=Solitalea lacus TaxID=2911172 RepID=UPI001EDAF73E|nr:aspartyl protease family protein [Solitalea lacus]UKJ07997.1 aspartyl protease family protein [Solitalea lacus]
MICYDNISFKLPNFYRKLLLSVFLLFSGLNAFSQYQFQIKENKSQFTMPFEFNRNLIILPVYINDKGPFNFILDSGVSIVLITNPSLKDSLNLQLGRQVTIKGLGEGDDLIAQIVTGMNMSIGKAECPIMAGAILPKDILDLTSYVGMPVFGIIGYDFFSSFVVKINYVNQVITVFNSDEFKPPRKCKPIPLLIENQRAYVFADVIMKDNTSVKTKLIIDTGAGHPVSLEPSTNPAIKVPDSTLSAFLGRGLSGPIDGHIGRIKHLAFSDIEVNNVITSFPNHNDVTAKVLANNRNGNIGNDLLKRFTVIFDYQRSQMFLKPNAYFNLPFEHDMSGLELITSSKDSRRYFVSLVQPGSPADQAGLQKDDEIISINLRPVSEMPVSEVDNLLRSKDNRGLLIQFHRKNTTGSNYVVLTLKRRV